MNSLSWLLYGAEVVENARGMLAGGMIVGALAVPGAWVAAAFLNDFHDVEESDVKAVRDKWRLGLTIAIASAVIWVPLPSSRTIMLIAASEVGETVLASPQAQSIGGEAGELATDSLRVLRKFINEQLETSDKP